MSELPRICTPTDSYTRHYPHLVELANKQLEKQFWTSGEMKVELDRMQLLYELSSEQFHAVKTVLHLFLRYELMVGRFWEDVVAKTFPRPEVQLAASVVAMTERAIHAEFYNQLNVVLGMDTDEDYLAYVNDKELNDRVEWLGELLGQEDKILATIIFSMTETALLFSSFAVLKSFQSNGYNMLPVIVRGTNQSAIDEDLHGIISAEIINNYYAEIGGKLVDDTVRYEAVKQAVNHALEHECRIIDMAFLSDTLNGVDKRDMKEFVKYRLNVYLERLQLPKMFDVSDCTIVGWFEKNTYSYKAVDFFTKGVGSEYESSWNNKGFGAAWEVK
jgi:ribonucleotide reductase beta subunit family protein with ferritin-like domain